MSFTTEETTAIDNLANKYNADSYHPDTNEGGMADGGHRVNFTPAIQDIANVANAVGREASNVDEASNTATAKANEATASATTAIDAKTEAEAARDEAQNAAISLQMPTNPALGDYLVRGENGWENKTKAEVVMLLSSDLAKTDLSNVDMTTYAKKDLSNVTSAVSLILKGYSETVNALGDVSGATVIDFSLGNVVTATLTDATTFSFSNIPSGSASMTISLLGSSSHSIAWPAGIKWKNDPSFSATSTTPDKIELETSDGGTTIYAWQVWEGE